MKKIISKVTYNTDTAVEKGKATFGEFGNPYGYEEILMQTKKGAYFLHAKGGEVSKYPEETLIPLTDKEAKAWIKENN